MDLVVASDIAPKRKKNGDSPFACVDGGGLAETSPLPLLLNCDSLVSHTGRLLPN